MKEHKFDGSTGGVYCSAIVNKGEVRSFCGLPAGDPVHRGVAQRQDIAVPHKYVAFKNLNLCSVYDSVRSQTCALPVDNPIHQPQPPTKSIETLAGELAEVIVNATTTKFYDTEHQSDSRIQRLLIAFAAEIKRTSIEP